MKLTFSAIIAVCIALAEAVPSAKRDMECKSTGRSGRLIGHNSATGAKSIFEFDSTDNLSTLHEVLKTDQEFEFYSCKAPSNEFAGAGFVWLDCYWWQGERRARVFVHQQRSRHP